MGGRREVISRFQRKYHNILAYPELMFFKAFFNGLSFITEGAYYWKLFSVSILLGGFYSEGLINGEVVFGIFTVFDQ